MLTSLISLILILVEEDILMVDTAHHHVVDAGSGLFSCLSGHMAIV